MAVVCIEGFDHLSAAQFGPVGKWSTAPSTVQTGRISGQAGACQNSSMVRSLGAAYSTLILGCAIKLTTTSSDTIVQLRGSTTVVAELRVVTSGGNQVWRVVNASGTTLATGTHPVVANAWNYIELKVVVSASVGSVELRLNGASTPEASASSVNTGSTNIDNILFVTGQSQLCHVDDMYCVDTTGSAPTNTFLGDVRVETLAPNGNGANTAWNGTYTDWDDSTSHDTDSTYVDSSTPGDRETSTLTDLALTSGTIFGVQTNLIARKDDAGTRTIAPVIRIGSTNYDGTTTPGLSSSFTDFTQIYDRLDPSGAGWTVSTVNAMEAGVKEVA